MSWPIDAPPESPGHAGHTPTPEVNLGLSAGRLHDPDGGLFGSAIVRALTSRPESAGTLGAMPQQAYAGQVFGIPGGMEPGSPKLVPSAKVQQASHAHVLLQLEAASIELGRSDRVDASTSQGLQDALDASQTWQDMNS
jgi:hypothetical protein